MQKLIYFLVNKFFMNKVEFQLLNYIDSKKKYNNKVEKIKNFLEKYNFEQKKIFKMPILSFLSGRQGIDHLFLHKKYLE